MFAAGQPELGWIGNIESALILVGDTQVVNVSEYIMNGVAIEYTVVYCSGAPQSVLRLGAQQRVQGSSSPSSGMCPVSLADSQHSFPHSATAVAERYESGKRRTSPIELPRIDPTSRRSRDSATLNVSG